MQEKTENFLDRLEKSLKNKGKRLTAPRRKVMGILMEQDSPLGAYDVIYKMQDAKPMTVYRALEFLSAEGLVHRIESLNAYVACAEDHCAHTDSQFLICDDCGKIEEIHDHALDARLARAADESGFTLTRRTLELHGVCAACR